MTAKEVDKRMPEPCTNVYRGWDDLGVLNELQQSHCVVDFKPGAARILWANAFYLKEHGLTESSVVAAKLPTRGDGGSSSPVFLMRIPVLTNLIGMQRTTLFMQRSTRWCSWNSAHSKPRSADREDVRCCCAAGLSKSCSCMKVEP